MTVVVKNLPADAGNIRDVGLIPGSGRSPGGGHGNPFQASCLENPMDRGDWQAMVHRVAKRETQLKWFSIANSSDQTAATPYMSPEKTQDVRTQDTGPDNWGTHQRNYFSEPRLLHSPIHRKVLDSMGYLVLFFLINSNILFQLAVLCCKTPIYPSNELISSSRVLFVLEEQNNQFH